MRKKIFLTPHELAERWSQTITTRTLANWRSVSRGPKFIKVGGKVLYAIADVEAWEQQRSVQGTCEYDGLTFVGEGI